MGYFNRYAYTANDPVNAVDPDGRQFLQNFFRGVTDWAQDTGYWLGNRIAVPLTRQYYDPNLYQEWEMSTRLADGIMNHGIANWERIAPIAVERMLQNPGYTAGRLTAGSAVGRYTGRGVGAGSVVLGIGASTQGQIDRFAASAVSGDFDPSLVLGAQAETIIDDFFSGQGFDISFNDNDDGTTTLIVSRIRPGWRIRERYEVTTYRREQEEE